MKNIFAFFILFATNTLFAQLEKTVHQTFNVTDAKNIMIELKSEYELQSWPGDAVLVETNIKLENATNAILNYVVESGRYAIVLDDQGNGENFSLRDKNTKRANLNTKNGSVSEIITVKIFVPETFEIIGKEQLVRKAE